MPLWVKFDKVPDSYWTREGLSHLASAIGKPLAADDLTRKLEILPFAKICVDYNIGDDLPTKLDVEVLDPFSEELKIQEVLVSYPNRPIVCTGCKTLGHLVGACPKTNRKWVVKKRSLEDSPVVQAAQDKSVNASVAPVQVGASSDKLVSTAEDEWHTVQKKSRSRPVSVSPATASPPVNFKNLNVVDEVEAKHIAAESLAVEFRDQILSKSQRKKMRRSAKAVGISPQASSPS